MFIVCQMEFAGKGILFFSKQEHYGTYFSSLQNASSVGAKQMVC